MHIDSIDLMIFIGGIIINSLCCVAAGSVESDLIFAFCYFAAATLLIYGAEDVEELADAFEFGVAGSGVHFCEGNFGKAGGGGKVSREAEGAHTAAVGAFKSGKTSTSIFIDVYNPAKSNNTDATKISSRLFKEYRIILFNMAVMY